MGVYEKQIVPIKISRLAEYVSQRKRTGLQALALLKRYGADDFLLDYYDLLHTQGTGYVIDEIDLLIRDRKRRKVVS